MSVALTALGREASTCTRCQLAATRTNVVFGVGAPFADLLFVGEAPGREEDLAGEPFVGRSGQLLDRLVLEELGVTRDRFYIANTLKCRPPGNRDPRPEETAACRPWLDGQVAALDPQVVVTLGNFATRAVLATAEGISRLRGRCHRLAHRTVVPTYHPSYVLRSGGVAMAEMRADLVRAKEVLGWT